MRGRRQREGGGCRAAPDPCVFDGPVEKESILPERPAEGSAIVVLRKLSALGRVVKVVGRCKAAVPVILKDRAVELIGPGLAAANYFDRSEEHTSELQSLTNLVCR